MAANDYAIVVGISDYPDLGGLDGPEYDARDFHAWLVGPGGVPPANAALILSSTFKPPAFTSVLDAKPTMDAIQREFTRLDVIAGQNQAAGNGRVVGRRLYLYYSGHGFGPDLEEASILMADASPVRTGLHVPGKPWANWFLRAGYFKEVVLLMDCCRESYPRAPLNVPSFINLTAPDVKTANRFYGFSAGWGKLSRERQFNGRTHGVFTWTLLEGLRGAAADPAGNVTAVSLGSYLYNNMRAFLDPADLGNDEVAKEPDLSYDANAGSGFVLAANVPVRTYPVTLAFSAATAGKGVRVFNDKFAPVGQTVAGAAPWGLSLPRGLYLAVADGGAQQPIDVSGTGAVNVTI
ncbi:MAG TPA: caspase family protein [Gemmatimonadaceae bacterium]|nr:caspase family protein [Gemmatimonadaceae bacterium]